MSLPHEAAIRTVPTVLPVARCSPLEGAGTHQNSLNISLNLYRRWALVVMLYFFLFPPSAFAIGQEQYVESTAREGSFPIADGDSLATICVDPNDYPGVLRAANDLREDIGRVTGRTSSLVRNPHCAGPNVILIGTIGKSSALDEVSRSGKIDFKPISRKWESFLTQVVPQPLPGIDQALVIAGSDKRGTTYGIYDLSEQIGVSPWYWWADVPIQHRDTLFVKPGIHAQGPPAVKYRGIFLNDEAPSLTGWVKEKYGNYNHFFYEKVFELILRLKGNYLWPAMWNNAFNEDDPLNPKLADEDGIVMGTSHHEPMLRAQQEWKRHGTGPWDYSKNADTLGHFWEEGIDRNKNYESIITLGMRSDGDLPMSPTANIELLETIVADQRKILAEHMNPDLSKIPQDWALYKEVQEYYEKGMRVPDDVTLLWSDDNWGNVRRVPTADERKRSGGAGIYYHFDYVGDPRSYKWLNTIPITKVWEQMNLAYRYGADRIWIVNVGDLKPMEFPMDFFLTLAWNPDRWNQNNLADFGQLWAAREFGPEHAAEIANIISKYTKYNGRRKPEFLEPTTFSLVNYHEADTVLADFRSIAEQAESIYKTLPENARDAFYELVLYPTKACANLTELYLAVGRNRLYAAEGRASTNDLASNARALSQTDADLSSYYNHALAHGKWDHMMDQTHIGYTSWRDPPVNVMPEVKELSVPKAAEMAVAVEGSAGAWPGASGQPTLPEFDAFNQQVRFVDIFNRGRSSFSYSITASAPWILVDTKQGQIEKETRVRVRIDWSKVPEGTSGGAIAISRDHDDQQVSVGIRAFNPANPTRNSLNGFVEADGYVSMEAEHYSARHGAGPVHWEKIPDYGRTDSSMTIFPVTAASANPPADAASLEYRMFLFDAGKVTVHAIVAPTLNFVPGRGLRFALSFDDQPPQMIDILAHNSLQDWAEAVKDSVRIATFTTTLEKPGYHTLKIWMVDPGVVLQKLVVDLGGRKESYLGPPESYRNLGKGPF